MNKAHFEDQIPFYVAGLLPLTEQADFESHLKTCADCQAALEEWRIVAQAVSTRAAQRVTQLPPLHMESFSVPSTQANQAGLNGQIRVTNQQGRGSTRSRYTRSLRRPQWITLAVALIILIALGRFFILSYAPQSVWTAQVDDVLSLDDLQPITVSNAAGLAQIEKLGNGTVDDVVWSPDGKTLALAGAAGVWLFNAHQPMLQPILLPVSNDRIQVVVFSPDGKFLAAGGFTGEIHLWDAGNYAPLQSIRGNNPFISVLTFSPDSQLLASGGGDWDIADAPIEIWKVATGEKYLSLSDANGQVRNLAFSPDGKRLASASGIYFTSETRTTTAFSIKLWDVATGEKVATIQQTDDSFVDGLAFSPDGKTLAANEKNFIALWDIDDLDNPRLIDLPGTSTTDHFNLAFSPDGSRFIAGRVQNLLSTEGGIYLLVYDLETTDLLLTITVPNPGNWFSQIGGLAYSPDGNKIAAVVKNKFYLWDALTGDPIETSADFNATVLDTTLSDNALVATSDLDGDVTLWDIATREKLRVQHNDVDQFRTLALSHNGELLATSGGENGLYPTVRIQSAATGEILHEFQPTNGHYPGVAELTFTPDDKLLIVLGSGISAQLWDVETGEEAVKLQFKSGETFRSNRNYSDKNQATDGEVLLSVLSDNTIGAWDVQTGEKIRNFAGHATAINALALSRNGTIMASASTDHTVRLWDVETGTSTQILDVDARLLNLSPDGKLLVTAGEFEMKIWDTSTGTELVSIPTYWINNVIFSSDGRYIVTGGGDGMIRVWGIG